MAFGGSVLVLGPGGRDLDPEGLLLAGGAALLLAPSSSMDRSSPRRTGPRLAVRGARRGHRGHRPAAVVALDAGLRPCRGRSGGGWSSWASRTRRRGSPSSTPAAASTPATPRLGAAHPEPVAAVGFGWWLLEEEPSLATLAGVVLCPGRGAGRRDAGVLGVVASPGGRRGGRACAPPIERWTVFLGENLLATWCWPGGVGGGEHAGGADRDRRSAPEEGDLEQAPVARSIAMATVGLVAAIGPWPA